MPETTPPAGAMPAEAGAMPAQTPPASPAPDPQDAPPATGDDAALGDTGKRALDDERRARREAEKANKTLQTRLEELENSTRTDQEKAVAEARKTGADEERAKLAKAVRRSEVKGALIAAGANPAFLDLAVRAEEFADLEVDEDGRLPALAEAIKTFKESHKDVFRAAQQAGSSDGGARGNGAITKEQAIAWSKDPVEYEKHRAEIMAWQAAQQT